MPLASLLGRRVTLLVDHLAGPGAFLRVPADAGEATEMILLPAPEVPADTKFGDSLDVFVYQDSEDRTVATLKTPMILWGEVVHLKAKDRAGFGVFFEWGLPKDLLVARGEQTTQVREGESYAVTLMLDDKGRLAGTMRVSEALGVGDYTLDRWVEGEAWRNEPGLGVFVILEKRFVGLLPEQEPHRLERGEHAKFRIAKVHPDGKVDLSLRAHAHEEIDRDAITVLAQLIETGADDVSDDLSPTDIREVFGMSKKAFKRAVGHLLKERLVQKNEQGYYVPTPEGEAPRE